MDNKYILEKLWNCISACENSAIACLDEAEARKMRNCIRTGRDCAEICNLTACLISRNSPHALFIMEECIEVCSICARESEKFAQYYHCRECARSCRECKTALENALAGEISKLVA